MPEWWNFQVCLHRQFCSGSQAGGNSAMFSLGGRTTSGYWNFAAGGDTRPHYMSLTDYEGSWHRDAGDSCGSIEIGQIMVPVRVGNPRKATYVWNLRCDSTGRPSFRMWFLFDTGVCIVVQISSFIFLSFF